MTFHVCFFIVCKDFFSGQKYVFVYFDGNTLFYTFQATSFKGVLVEKNYTFFPSFFLKEKCYRERLCYAKDLKLLSELS